MKRKLRIARGAVLAVMLALTQAPATAHAQADAAEEQFRRGLKAVERGDFERAAQAFEAAQHLAPHPVTAYNAALAWQSAGDRAHAADDFLIALGSGLARSQQAEAQKRLASLETDLVRVEMIGPPGSTVRVRDESRALPVKLHAIAGDAIFEARLSDGRTVSRRAALVAGTKIVLDFTEVTPAAPPASPPPEHGQATAERSKRWQGWVALGAGVALVGGSIGVGLAGLAARDSWVNGYQDQSAHDRAIALRTWSNVLWISGAAAGAVGIAVLVWPSHDKAAPTTALGVGVGVVGLHTRF